MIDENKTSFVTARITISLPYQIYIKEGDLYETIKILDAARQVIIHPFEYSGSVNPVERGGGYGIRFRKIRVDVTLPAQSRNLDFSNSDQRLPFFDLATHYLNIFLEHCRTKSRQFWIHPVYLNGPNIKQAMYEVQFLTDKSEVLYGENNFVPGLVIFGVGINQQVWQKIKNDILHDIKHSIVNYHIEEARAAVFSKNVEILIINIAVALEIFVSRFCLQYAGKVGKETDPYFKCLSEKQGNFVFNYFKKIIPYLTSKDLRAEQKYQYDQLDYLFRTRNKIVHEGKSYYNDKKGTVQPVDNEKAHKFFLSVMEIMEWFRSIDFTIAEEINFFLDT